MEPAETAKTEVKARIEMFGDYVLVRPKELDEVSEGGIFLPEMKGQTAPVIGTVVGVGDDLPDEKEARRPRMGDEVMYLEFSGSNLEIDGSMYKVLRVPELVLRVVVDERPLHSEP